MYRSSLTRLRRRVGLSAAAGALALGGVTVAAVAGASPHSHSSAGRHSHTHVSSVTLHSRSSGAHQVGARDHGAHGADGVISAVSATSITLAEHGVAVTFTINSSTTVTVGSTASTASALAVGEHVRVTPSTSDPTIAGAIQIELVRVEGTLSAASATSITVSTEFGGTATFAIDASTTVTKDGAAATAADLAVGQKVVVTPSASNPTTAASIAIHAKVCVSGTISAVSASSLTLTPRSGGSVTFALTAFTTVTSGGTASSVSALAVGQSVKVTSTDGTTAATVAISPARQLRHGTVTALSATTFTITSKDNNGDADDSGAATTATYTVNSSTTYFVGRTAATSTALGLNEMVMVQPTAADPTVAGVVEIVPVRVVGTVSSIGSNTFVVTVRHGGTVTIAVGASTTFTTAGAASTLSALATGDGVIVIGEPDAVTATTIDAASVTFGAWLGGGEHGGPVHAFGGGGGSGGSGFGGGFGGGRGREGGHH